MVLTLRLGRVYERWWQVRQAFSCVGSTATSLSQRVSAWADPNCPRQQRLAADTRRWAVVWHFSILHVCQNASAIHPDGAKLLTPEEMAIYKPARKGRQVAVDKLVQLISDFDFEEKKFNALEQLLQRGVTAAGICTGVRFQALPYSLTTISTGFVELFLVSLLLLMVQPTGPGNHPDSVADTLFTVCVVWALYFGICLLFLGADEVANQLEDPFPWLPLYDIVATTERDAMRVPDELKALREAERARQRREEEGERGLVVAPS
jgi:predicted membrane chloride channel (bestrophin family)